MLPNGIDTGVPVLPDLKRPSHGWSRTARL